jgi:hypothetical protein
VEVHLPRHFFAVDRRHGGARLEIRSLLRPIST